MISEAPPDVDDPIIVCSHSLQDDDIRNIQLITEATLNLLCPHTGATCAPIEITGTPKACAHAVFLVDGMTEKNKRTQETLERFKVKKRQLEPETQVSLTLTPRSGSVAKLIERLELIPDLTITFTTGTNMRISVSGNAEAIDRVKIVNMI